MVELSGYTGRVLRVNLSENEVRICPLERDYIYNYLGGRGFNSRRLLDEVPLSVNPLDPENKLMISTGPLVGTMFPTACRFNVSAKSPLTGILGDSNAGGHLAPEIKYAGYDQIILEGRSSEPVYLQVIDSDVGFKDASHLRGMDIYETDKAIRSDLGEKDIQTLITGPAAENGVLYGGLFANLMRAAARTGMGTVLASKNVKAIAIKGTGTIDVAHPAEFMRLVEDINDEIKSHEQYWPRREMGTTRILLMANEMGFLPTRHYTSGVFEHAEEVSGERLAKKYNVKSRGCFACNIPCSRFYVINQGPFSGFYGEGPEYEALGAFTSRIGNRDLNSALVAIDLCNKYGLDALTAAECISWAMELYETGELCRGETDGLDLSWGNIDPAIELLKRIKDREGFGDVLADGSLAAAEKLGKGRELTMQVKGLDLIMADPRGLKGFGLGFAVASRGGDHLRSEPFIELSDDPSIGQEMFGVPESTLRLADKGKGKLVSYFEDWCAVIDALEPCKNIMQNMMILPFKRASEVLHATTDISLSPDRMRMIGERIVNTERLFNMREGISREDDKLPRRFRETPLKEGASRGTVFLQDELIDEYYDERGWDRVEGRPQRETLRRLGLEQH
ncbi:MAG: aldehyde ferredoxin oxidoreductase family protein [Candidatus Bathyarchaeia archaeon]